MARHPSFVISKSSLNLRMPTVETMAVPIAAQTFIIGSKRDEMKFERESEGHIHGLPLTAYAMLISRLFRDRANPKMLQVSNENIELNGFAMHQYTIDMCTNCAQE
jgi:hypothetical protein